MTEIIPPHQENHSSRKNLDEYSDLLDELARIRKDIEQESLPPCHPASFEQSYPRNQEISNHAVNSGEVCQDDKSLPPHSFQRFYRFDLDHLEREDLGCLNNDSKNYGFSESKNNDTNISRCDKEFKESLYHPELKQADEKPKQFSQQSKPKRSEIKSNFYRYDDGPVLIPIRRNETRISKRNPKSICVKPLDNHRLSQNDLDRSDVVDFSTLPWGLINQYENESFANIAGNAGNLSLFIGWVSIACGVVIFARSFYVGSAIWLNYGLPVVALGAACLFLGIILSILSDKMLHINDLKQSLTAHRILNQPSKKIDSPPTGQNENRELEDVYDRLVKLRSEINELIDGCEEQQPGT